MKLAIRMPFEVAVFHIPVDISEIRYIHFVLISVIMNLENLTRRVKDIFKMREFQNLARDVSALCLMAQMHVTGTRKLNLWTLLIISICFLYVVSFIDLLPDFIPIVGWLDDIWCIRQACSMIRKEIEAFNAWLPDHPEEVVLCRDKWNQMTKIW